MSVNTQRIYRIWCITAVQNHQLKTMLGVDFTIRLCMKAATFYIAPTKSRKIVVEIGLVFECILVPVLLRFLICIFSWGFLELLPRQQYTPRSCSILFIDTPLPYSYRILIVFLSVFAAVFIYIFISVFTYFIFFQFSLLPQVIFVFHGNTKAIFSHVLVMFYIVYCA